MSQIDLHLPPPQISASCYFDTMDPEDAFLAVCEQVEAAGATASGVFEVVHAASFPPFAMISDLVPRLEVMQLDVHKSKTETWKRLIAAQKPEVQVLRAAFEAPKVGPAIVTFEPIPHNPDLHTRHPVAVAISGELLSMPAHVSLSRREQQQAALTAQFLLSTFRSACEAHNPLYSAILVEQPLPTPQQLIEGNARLSTELFVSNRLLAVDAELERDLGTLFAAGSSQQWATGVFFSGWAVFSGKVHTIDTPLKVSEQAARYLGRALRKYPEAMARR
jgi:hypothetical protein